MQISFEFFFLSLVEELLHIVVKTSEGTMFMCSIIDFIYVCCVHAKLFCAQKEYKPRTQCILEGSLALEFSCF